MYSINILWKIPQVNPINYKARSIPALNVVDTYGRVFFFSWFGFFIAFWSWYAFSPLLSVAITKDLHLSQKDISNSNIIALTATLLVRIIAGPACDRYGPRLVFVATLLAGAIPTALAGTVNSVKGLLALRFFIGVLGGSFVPCQVWTTAFFDKNIVGTANALTAGLGNAGGGVTYFLMPTIFDSLVHDLHHSPHQAWRITFIVPFIAITAVAMGLLFLCPDSPAGKWSERHRALDQQTHKQTGIVRGRRVVDISDQAHHKEPLPVTTVDNSSERTPASVAADFSGSDEKKRHSGQSLSETAHGEIGRKPTFKEAIPVIFSPQTLAMCVAYFTSFGAELAINSILGAYYLHNFPSLGQTGSGRWAAMFGLLNVIFRPLGGVFGDVIYNRLGPVPPSTSSPASRETNDSQLSGLQSQAGMRPLWGKKAFLHVLCVGQGLFLLLIGLLNPTTTHRATMFGLVVGLAFFLEAANGANFALVPHVHPQSNGIVSGFTGAAGNLGGIVFAIIFRTYGKDYAKVFWIIGLFTIAMNLAVCWIRPVPKSQLAGR